ncbi:MAG: thiamine diphosphokinase [Clostridia bacterium]|nr:thiamine diphosphokinase [Clostridia bacterium]
MKSCVIFGAGPFDGRTPVPKADLYIAADAGLETMRKTGLSPDLVIGDFDSLTAPLPAETEIVRLPVKKDVTDLDAAVREAQKRGSDTFYLFGVLGGRPDHSYANLSLLARLASDGCKATLYGAGYTVTAVHNGCLCLAARESGTVSVFSFTDKSEGVTIRGLQYALENATLTSGFALGVSNAFRGLPAEISVENGVLLVMVENA